MRTNPLVLVVPGLLRPRAADHEPEVTTQIAPHLARLLATAGAPSREPEGIDAVLAAAYGIARQTDWPLAPIHAQALGLDLGQDYWLCADPVTLVAGRDNVRLESTVTDLTAAETSALLAMLNAHFAGDGLTFVAPRPNEWFVHTATAPAIATRPLAAALRGTLRDLLPTGRDAGQWRRWQNEIQMLFFDHPVNVARESAARLPVNSVWFSGGGTRPSPSRSKVRTLADGGPAASLAAFAGLPAVALPALLDPVLASAADDATIVAAYDLPPDPAAADRALIGPAWKALPSRAVDSVTLVTDGAGEAVAWTAQRPSAWQRMTTLWHVPDLARLLAAVRADHTAGRS